MANATQEVIDRASAIMNPYFGAVQRGILRGQAAEDRATQNAEALRQATLLQQMRDDSALERATKLQSMQDASALERATKLKQMDLAFQRESLGLKDAGIADAVYGVQKKLALVNEETTGIKEELQTLQIAAGDSPSKAQQKMMDELNTRLVANSQEQELYMNQLDTYQKRSPTAFAEAENRITRENQARIDKLSAKSEKDKLDAKQKAEKAEAERKALEQSLMSPEQKAMQEREDAVSQALIPLTEKINRLTYEGAVKQQLAEQLGTELPQNSFMEKAASSLRSFLPDWVPYVSSLPSDQSRALEARVGSIPMDVESALARISDPDIDLDQREKSLKALQAQFDSLQ